MKAMPPTMGPTIRASSSEDEDWREGGEVKKVTLKKKN
jgi:hypothetical protein